MLVSILLLLIRVIEVLVFIRIIISWLIPYSNNEFVALVNKITEPMLAPFRVRIPLGGVQLDIAPIILYFVLGIASKLIIRFL